MEGKLCTGMYIYNIYMTYLFYELNYDINEKKILNANIKLLSYYYLVFFKKGI